MKSVDERFAKKYVVSESGCWVWVGANTGNGHKLRYGRFYVDRIHRVTLAHRWSYQRNGGVIPDGMEIDHLCRNTLCVNPAHLEPVTRRENVIRGTSPNAVNAAKTHCINGHALTAENCYAYRWPKTRQCKACARQSSRNKTAEKNAKALRLAIREING